MIRPKSVQATREKWCLHEIRGFQLFDYGLNVTWTRTLETKEKRTHPSAVHMLKCSRMFDQSQLYIFDFIERFKLEIGNRERSLTTTWRWSTKEIKIKETKAGGQVLTGSIKQNHQSNTVDNRAMFIYFLRKTTRINKNAPSVQNFIPEESETNFSRSITQV